MIYKRGNNRSLMPSRVINWRWLILTIILAISVYFSKLTYAFSEHIDSFHTNYILNTDGTVQVEETIDYNFGSQQKHGIFRNIPRTKINKEGEKFVVRFDEIEVFDKQGREMLFTISQDSDDLEIKIGDPDKFVTGNVRYVVEYTMAGALTYFSDHDEFYWNVTGDEWQVPILKARAEIIIPASSSEGEGNIKGVCYTGVAGSTEQMCTVQLGTAMSQSTQITFNSIEVLYPGQQLTVVASFPKGVVEVLEPISAARDAFWQNLILVLLGIAYLIFNLILSVKVFLDWKHERAKVQRLSRIASAWFDPPKSVNGAPLEPALAGILPDKKVHTNELSATIVQLARKKVLKITAQSKKDIILTKQQLTQNPDEVITPLEDLALDVFFDKSAEVNIRNIKKSTSIALKVKKFYDEVYKESVREKLFSQNPDKEFQKNIGFGIVLLSFAFVLPGILYILFSRAKIKRTETGIEKYSEVMSLKNFLVSQEEKLDFQSENIMLFEKLLPYATALGVEKVWLQRFKNLDMQKLEWYEGTNDIALVSVLGRINSTATSLGGATSTTSSSGFSSGFSGGSSGGGGGGGGGGSW